MLTGKLKLEILDNYQSATEYQELFKLHFKVTMLLLIQDILFRLKKQLSTIR